MVKHNMKKIYLGLLLVAILGLIIPTYVIATEQETEKKETNEPVSKWVDETENQQIESMNPSTSTGSGKGLRLIGKWGHGKDEEADGYVAARITRRGRVGLFRGFYNLTDEDEKTQIVGIMKKGYFNGKIITDEGSVKLTGLYKVDRDEHLLKMQWMSPGHAGWAVGRLSVIDV